MDGIIIIELYMYPGVVHNCFFPYIQELKTQYKPFLQGEIMFKCDLSIFFVPQQFAY